MKKRIDEGNIFIRIIVIGFVLLTVSGIVRYRHAFTPLPFQFLDQTSVLPLVGGGFMAVTTVLAVIWLSRFPTSFVVPFAVLLSGGLRAWWVSHVETMPVYDFLTVSEAALSIAGGDLSVLKSPYFTRFAYQIPFALWESIFYRLFGPDHRVMEWVHVLLYAFIPLLGYVLTVKLLRTQDKHASSFSKRAGGAVALFLAIEPSSLMMSSVLTNQYSALFFYLLSLIATMQAIESVSVPKKLSWSIVSGLFLALGGLLRPLAIVYMIALLLYMFIALYMPDTFHPAFSRFNVFIRRIKQQQKRPDDTNFNAPGPPSPLTRLISKLSPLLTILVYFVVTQLVSMTLMTLNITDRPLKNDEPEWKFVAGLNRESIGHFTKADADLVLSYPQGESRRAVERALILERLKEPGLLMFFVTKIQYLWGFVDQAWKWADWQPPGEWLSIVLVYERLLFALMLLGLMFVPIKGRLLYPLFIVLIYAGIHLIIEIQVRYRYDMLVFIYMLGTIGLCWIRAVAAEYKIIFTRSKNVGR
ncbi:MAG: membrane protein [Candidatus Carbobacillus altaicus]|uniref:Membrane protein n=1 Tax=Candidatus Carbonibacillus altaicus TaxID=2163959 RepID=A0A2R6XZY2_9BACL|nr:MAG: membrane protein [Candidatus Carbobacillus altaicus]